LYENYFVQVRTASLKKKKKKKSRNWAAEEQVQRLNFNDGGQIVAVSSTDL